MKSRKPCFTICHWSKVTLAKTREYSLVYVMCPHALRGVIFIGVLKKYKDIRHEVNATNKASMFQIFVSLLFQVVDDLQETKLFTMYYPSLELEVYPCKGHDIVVSHLTQTTNGLSTRRVLAVGHNLL